MNQQKLLFITILFVSSVISSKFPLKDILHFSQDVKVAEENYLCSIDIRNRYKNEKCCECTRDCMKYKTCCIDFLWNSTAPIPSQEYLDLFINVTNQYKDTTCEPVFQNAQNNTSENILMVSTCLKHANHQDKEGCKNAIETSYESIMPVFGSDQYIYKNSFCARCNFVKHYQLLNLTAKCKTQRRGHEEHENPYQRFMSCFFNVALTKTITNYIKTCNINIFDKQSACNKTNKYYEMCSSYLGVVGNSANYHCLMCNNTSTGYSTINLPNFACSKYIANDESEELQESDESDESDGSDENDNEDDDDDDNHFSTKLKSKSDKSHESDESDELDQSEKDGNDDDDNSIRKPNYKWSFTINFANQTNIVIQATESYSMKFCDSGKIYNIISSRCEIFYCSRGYKKSVNGCFQDKDTLESQIEVVPNATFDKCLIRNNITMIVVMYPSKDNSLATNEVLLKLLNTSTPTSSVDIEINEGNIYHLIGMNINQDQLTLLQKTLADREYLTRIAIEKLYLTSLPSKDLKNRLETDFTKCFKGGQSCAEPVTVTNISDNFMENCSYIFQNRMFDISNTNFWVEINRTSWKRKLISCSLFYLHSSCPLKQITNYTLFENKTLKVGNNFYNASQYVPLNDSFRICIPTNARKVLFSSYEWHDNLSKALDYISISGTIMSIVSYAVIIIVYQFIKAVKRSPSATIVFQCITLLVVDTTFLVAIRMHFHTFGCKVIAIFLHWGLLAAQLWTAIIVFDLSLKVRSVSAIFVKTDSTRLAAYCITAYIIPTFIVGTTVHLHIYHIIDMSYGENGICFINNPYSKLYFYCIPLAAIYFITISLLVYTLSCIWKRENKARKIFQKSGRHNENLLSIAFKLILALGLIEILGFTQISKKNLSENELIFNSIFAALYTILRSLRGLWLFLIYVCNRRKMKILKSTWRNNAGRLNAMRLS